MNTLALRGLEEPFFQLCCCVVSVFGSGGKLCKIECIEYECNELVLVLVQIDLIHFEHSICISLT